MCDSAENQNENLALSFFTNKWIKDSEKLLNADLNKDYHPNTLSVIIGSLLILLDMFFAGWLFCGCGVKWHYCCEPQIWIALFVIICAGVGGIILIVLFGKSFKITDRDKDEFIIMRDLALALKICEGTSDKDFDETTIKVKDPISPKTIVKRRSQKSKMEEQIIQTLLNRCNK